jgi:hypothetical protein
VGRQHNITEVTLALMLFTTQRNSSRFSCAVPLPSRAGSFLLIYRSTGAGYLVARGLFPDIRVWSALLLAAALAPTDDRGKDSFVINGNERPGVDLRRDQEREFISGLRRQLASC